MKVQEVLQELSQWKLTRVRVLHLAIGLSATAVYEFLARPIYRPYIYQHNINDFHIADTIGNSLGTVATVFVWIGLLGQGRSQHLFMIKMITLSVALYEVGHPLLGKPIDPWDIAATLLTGGFCLWLYTVLHPAQPVHGDPNR